MTAKILMVIPCLNEEKNIERLVQYVLLSCHTQPMNIIIADGGSTDQTAEIAQKLAAQHPNLFYLHNPKRLQSAAINLAVATYGEDAEFLIRLDAHADYPENYCQSLIEEVKLTQAASVVVTMGTQGNSWFQRAVAAAQNSKLGNGGSAHRSITAKGCWVDHGHHALMRIDAFRAVGGYDESFSHNEDAELDTRLRKAGFKIWLTAKTKLIYYPRSSPVRLFTQYMNYGRGRIRNIIKHRTRPKLRQMAPVVVLPAAILALGAPICWLTIIPLAAWAILCLGYGILLGIKAQDVTIMASGPAAMIMHSGWSLGFWRGLSEVLWRPSK